MMQSWTYDPSPTIDQNIAEQLTVFPREHDMTHTVLRAVWMCLLRALLRVYFRLHVRGREHLPSAGSFVLVSNHTSHLDTVCLSSLIPLRSINRAFAVAAKDYFFSSFWRCVLAVIGFNAIPFDRVHGKRESLERCADVLKASDRILIMFPEGTRSPSQDIQPFKMGIGVLVAGTDRRVVPTYIDGARAAWPRDARWPKPTRIRLVLGAPLQFTDVPRTREGFAHVARTVEAAVRILGAENAHGIL